MSNSWTVWIAVLSFGNIIGIMWLLYATGKKLPDDKTENADTTGHEWDGITELDTPMPRWWLWMFVGTTVFAIVYMLLYPSLGNHEGALGWTQLKQHEEALAANRQQQEAVFIEYRKESITELASNNGAMQTAGRLFANNCSTCHGSDAQGAPGFPNLADSDWLYGNSVEQVTHSIANGRAGVMPALGGVVGERGAYELAHYIENLNTQNCKDQDAVKAGEQRFQTTCAACHGADAKGNQALGAPNLRDDIWLHNGNLNTEAIQAIIMHGKTSNMPAHAELLSQDQIRLLTAYVLALPERK